MKKTPIIILHGWGCLGGKYHEIQKLFEQKGFPVFAPDLPGFGEEKSVKPVMNLDDYVQFVYSFLKKHNLAKVIIVAHSFGGRVASKFIYTHPGIVEKLIITGSPLIKQKLSFKKQCISVLAKVGKKIIYVFPAPFHHAIRWLVYRCIGEWDYYKARDLRETFSNIVNEDTAPYLPFISIPTVVIWGEQELLVPVVIGEEIAKRIPDATFVLIKNVGHRLPYEKPQEFAEAVISFLE